MFWVTSIEKNEAIIIFVFSYNGKNSTYRSETSERFKNQDRRRTLSNEMVRYSSVCSLMASSIGIAVY